MDSITVSTLNDTFWLFCVVIGGAGVAGLVGLLLAVVVMGLKNPKHHRRA